MRKASTVLAGEGDSNAVPFPSYNENQSTASVPIVNCLNGGVHPSIVCSGLRLRYETHVRQRLPMPSRLLYAVTSQACAFRSPFWERCV